MEETKQLEAYVLKRWDDVDPELQNMLRLVGICPENGNSNQ